MKQKKNSKNKQNLLMLYSYNKYTQILESRAREKKINKVKNKIKKFLNIDEIVDYIIDLCVNPRNTEGLQYAVWFANYIKTAIIDLTYDYIQQDGHTKEFKKIKREDIIEYLKNPKEKIKDFPADFSQNLLEDEFDGLKGFQKEEWNYILDWLKSPMRDEQVNLSQLGYQEAYKKSDDWHNSLKASGKIEDESGNVIIEFDDGYYWIDLQTTYSRDEADAMGHCGNTNEGDTLLSLRDKNKSPHVTVAWDSKEKIIYQMKGRQNKKPVEKYHKYIYRFLIDPELKPKCFAYEWNKEEDFNLSDFDKETFQKIYNYNPNLIYDSVQYDFRMVNGLIKKAYFTKEQVKEVLFNSEGVKFDIFMALVSYTEDGEEIDMFTNEELKKIYENSKIELKDQGELPKIILYNKDIIDDEEFASYFSELFVEEVDGRKKLRMEGDKDDLEPLMSDAVKSLIFSDSPFEGWDFPWYKIDSADSVWSDLTKETKAEVCKHFIKEMEGEEISYSYWRDDKERYFSDVELKKDMIKWVEENKDFQLEYNGNYYDIDKILDECNDCKTYDKLSRAYNMANEAATQDEYIKTAREALENKLGTIIKRDLRKYGKNRYYEVLIFDFHDLIDDLDSVEARLMEEYESYMDGSIDYDREDYGSFWAILAEYKDKADFDDGYGLYGDIDKDLLNDYLLDELSY